MRTSIAAVVVFALLCASSLFAQNAQLGGIVSDPGGALLPGVTVTSTNTATGVVTTTLSNESGAYSFPSLQPGRSYTVSAALTGFKTTTFTGIDLGPITVRRDIQLQLSTSATTVEVSADTALNAIAASSASVGDVLSESRKGAATFAGPPVQRNFQGHLRFSF